ncbi:hypothetical protein TRFO_21599 [Tritrichomonas foetus]|uniref:Uncharacterized protein n=1 Tax=Tritrichomonas foetus TaxID=1144522 RepID=A0A1J4KDN1_9EUKA|nr:hypothetical protein TRFO_21599 [Tritrichomonas foetus]|eukprot:OHT09543.1 hypothetical protein TRFO_21599 [Tritrichomonas foetus]
MFNLIPCFNSLQNDYGQIRVLQTRPDYLLIGSFRKNKTAIQLIQKDSTSLLVFKMDHNMDIINASLSSDNELLHVTEKIIIKNGEIAFRSKIYCLLRNSVSYECLYKEPVNAFFVDGNNSINFMIYSSEILSLANVEVTKQKINITKIKTFNNVIWFSYDKTNEILSLIYGVKFSYTLNIIHSKFTSMTTCKVMVHPQAKLPNDFSLLPINLNHLPLFRTTNYRIYIFKRGQSYVMIQQLFTGTNASCSFHISTFPTVFSQTVTVSGVASDIPICVFQKESLIFVFAPNSFISIIDTTNTPPFITTLPKQFATAVCGQCAAYLREQESVIDLDTSEIYKIELSFKFPQFYLQSLNSKALYGFATICARLPNIEYLSSILHIFELTNNHSLAIKFFRQFFSLCQDQKVGPSRSHSYLMSHSSSISQHISSARTPILHKRTPSNVKDALNDLEKEFPSASSMTRTEWFCNKINESQKGIENYNEILSFMKQQNNMVLNIRAAIEQWVAKYHPSLIWQMIVGLAIQNEATFNNFPAIPDLKDEIEHLSQKFCSKQMIEALSRNGLLAKKTKESNDNQVDYWSQRLPIKNLFTCPPKPRTSR